MKLPEFSVNRRVTASMMAMILVVVGLISFSRLGLDFFPDLEFPTVSVVTTYSGASSEDLEKSITKPLEQIVSGVNRIKKVTSTTTEGDSAITAELQKLIEDDVAPRLERIDGVAAARVFSTEIREILVDVDKTALESRNLSLDREIGRAHG